MKQFNLNYPKIPVLSVGFTRAHTLVAKSIQLLRGGNAAVKDESFPNHAFLVVDFNGQKFAAEETFDGLKMNSLEEYCYKDNRVVAMYYWQGWNNPDRKQKALNRIAYILREQGNKETRLGKYQTLGLLSFVPFLKKFISRDESGKEAEWCSENCASVHKNNDCMWFNDTHLAPDQLLRKMQWAEKEYGQDVCTCVLNYYL